jgi:putative membrane protein (TIGR04086 family)
MKIGSKGFIHGAIIGVLYILILGIISFLVEQGSISLPLFTIRLVMALVIGALAGMIGMVLGSSN